MSDYSKYHNDTYKRILLSDSPVKPLIDEYSISSKARVTPGFEKLQILTSTQIEQALQHPHNEFIVNNINAYAEEVKVRRKALQLSEEQGVQQTVTKQVIETVQKRSLSAEPEVKKNYSLAANAFDQQYLALTNIGKDLKFNTEEDQLVQKGLKELTNNQNEEWKAFRKENLQILASSFKSAKFDLTPDEEKELVKEESQAKILSELKEFGVTIPKEIDVTQAASYFQLKALRAARSSLSRRMLSHSTEDIVKQLNTFESEFEKVNRNGQKLKEKQSSETEFLVEKNIKPIDQALNKDQKELERVDTQRTQIIKDVIPPQEQARIQEVVRKELVEPAPPPSPPKSQLA